MNQVNTTLHTVSQRVPKIWDSWKDLQDYVSTTCADETFQLLKIRTTSSVESRNKQRKNPDASTFPPELIWYGKTWHCTHGGRSNEDRKYVPKTKARAKQRTRFIDCTAKINAHIFKNKDRSWKVKVSAQDLVHNHVLENNSYIHYP